MSDSNPSAGSAAIPALPMLEGARPRTPDRPWPGLGPFTPQDVDYFGGRDREIDEMCRLIARHPHAVLFGQSGLGKTSLLCAGVMPRLHPEGHLGVYLRIVYGGEMSPVAQVKAALTAALNAARVEGPRPTEAETLWEYFQRTDHFLWSRTDLVTPVLIFDQFEEMFTLGQSDGRRRAQVHDLLNELEWLVEGRPPPNVQQGFEADPMAAERYDFGRRAFKVVWSLREDFLPDLEGLRRRFHFVGHNRLRLAPLSGQQALAAVLKGGARVVGGPTARRIVKRVAGRRSEPGEGSGEEDLGRLRVEPALLSLMCAELNEARLRRLEEWRSMGRDLAEVGQIDEALLRTASDRILTSFYERCVRGLPDAVCAFVEERLVTGQGRFRQSAASDDFLAVPGATEEILRGLINDRLLRRDERFGTSTIELIHDVLVEAVREFREKRRRREAERVLARRNRVIALMAGVSMTAVLAAVLAVVASARARRLQGIAEEQRRLAATNELRAVASANSASNNWRVAEEERGKAANLARTNQDLLRQSLEASNRLWLVNLQLTNQLLQSDNLNRRLAQATNDLSKARDEAVAKESQARNAEAGRSAALYESLVDGARLLARNDSFASALDRLRESHSSGVDDRVPLGWVSSRNLLEWYVRLRNRPATGVRASLGVPLRDLTVSEDGRWLAVGGEQGLLGLFDLRPTPLGTGTKLTWKAHGEVARALVMERQGRWFVSGGDDNRIVRWSIPGGTPMGAESRLPSAVSALALSPDSDSRWVAAVSERDGVVTLLATEDLKNAISLPGKLERPTSLAFGPNGRRLAAGSADGQLWCWELEEARADWRKAHAPRVLAHFESGIRQLAFHPEGDQIATGCDDGTIQLWRTSDGALVRSLRGHRGRVGGLAYGHLGGRDVLVSGGADLVLRIWDLQTGETIGVMEGHTAAVSGVAVIRDTLSDVSPVSGVVRWSDGVFSASNDGSWRQWRLEAEQRALELTNVPPTPTSAALAPDASFVAVGSESGEVRVLGLPSGEERWRRADAHTARVSRLSVSPDGKTLASVGLDGRVRRWVAAQGEMMDELPTRPGAVHAVAWSPDSRWLATAGAAGRSRLSAVSSGVVLTNDTLGGEVALYDLITREARTCRVFAGDAFSVAFSPAGNRLVSAGADGGVCCWWTARFPDGPQDLEGPKGVDLAWAMFSPANDQVVATAGRDGLLRWRVLNDRESGWRFLAGHENTIVRLAFGTDGAQVWTASTDGTLRAWDLMKGEELFVLRSGVGTHRAVPIRDFAWLPRTPSGDAWLAIPLTAGRVVVHRLGPIYPEPSAPSEGFQNARQETPK